MTGEKRSFTYAELLDDVSAFAAVLRDKGVRKGDRVIIYMPMIPQAVIGMLACARHRRDPFRGVRRLRGQRTRDPHQRRQAEADPRGLLRARAGADREIQATAGCRHRAGIAQAGGCIIFQRADERAPLTPGRDYRLDGAVQRSQGARQPRRRGHPCPPPTRSTSSTPPARPASRRASFATMAGIWWR